MVLYALTFADRNKRESERHSGFDAKIDSSRVSRFISTINKQTKTEQKYTTMKISYVNVCSAQTKPMDGSPFSHTLSHSVCRLLSHGYYF